MLKSFIAQASQKIAFQDVEDLESTAGNTKGGSITVPLTSCLTGLELAV
jgi:hypothetical protein